MPIIPTYHRQERYSAPGVTLSAPAPARTQGAFENDLQEVGQFSKDVLQFLASAPPLKQKNADSAGAMRVRNSGGQSPQKTNFQETPAAYSPDENLRLRADLAETVRQEAAQKGAVQTQVLDSYAASHLPASEGETPAARDYMMLRAAAQQEEDSVKKLERFSLAGQEEKLVRSVGSLAAAPQALEGYLSAQLPAYEARLVQNGVPPTQVREQVKNLRAQTAAEHVRRSLGNGQLLLAGDVFKKYQQELPPQVQEECAQKIRLSAVRQQALTLWQDSKRHTDGTFEKRASWAKEKASSWVEEPLVKQVRQQITALQEAEEKKSLCTRAEIYQLLARAEDAEQAQALLQKQAVLSASEMESASQAVWRLGEGAPSDQATFNRLYFSAEEPALLQAFNRARVSPRDYLLLQAARLKREGGQPDADAVFFCRGLDAWREKKALPAETAEHMKYAVLSGADQTPQRLQILQHVKTLLDL